MRPEARRSPCGDAALGASVTALAYVPLMLIALLSDIHSNREALDACLAHARSMRAERFVFLGDYVGYGADPSYVVDTVVRMVEDGAVALLGNHDEAIGRPSESMNALARAAIDWTRARLDSTQAAFLQKLPLSLEQGECLFVHASAYAPAAWLYITDAQHHQHASTIELLRSR